MAKRPQETQKPRDKVAERFAPITVEQGPRRHQVVVNQKAQVFRSGDVYRRHPKHKGRGWDD